MNNLAIIAKDSKLLFGSGGSKTIIVITKDKRVYKYFPRISRINESDKASKHRDNDYRYEIAVLSILDKEFSDKTSHIIRLIRHEYYDIIPKNLFENCPSFTHYLQRKKIEKTNCLYIYYNYPQIIDKGLHVIEMEYCTSSLSKSIEKMIKSDKSLGKLMSFLDRILFQILYTLQNH